MRVNTTNLILLVFGFSTTVIGLEEWQVHQVVGRELHNRFRAKHNAPPLQLNETLNAAAQDFAEHVIKEKRTKTPKIRGSISKNSQTTKPEDIPLNANEAVKKAVTKWYSLITPEHWNNPNYTAFSALAWKGTTDLGVGVASNGIRTVVVSAYWHPESTKENVTKSKNVALVKKMSAVAKFGPRVYTHFGFDSRRRIPGLASN